MRPTRWPPQSATTTWLDEKLIDYIKGNIISKQPTYVVIDVNGIGYGLSIPLSTYTRLAGLNFPQHLYSWLYVRDDALQLFGFSTGEEREVFKLLLNVSGVGPKMALGVLSAMSVDEFIDAVRSGNIALLVSIPGIGRKKAERLLLELKDRVGTEFGPRGPEIEDAPGPGGHPVRDAVNALTSLGCRHSEAAAAVSKAVKSLGTGARLEEIIKESLKHL